MISFGLLYAIQSRISQAFTRWPGHPVASYGSVMAASAALARLAYRADTLQSAGDVALGQARLLFGHVPDMPLKLPARLGARKVDFLRHPSLIQRNLDWMETGPPPEGRRLDAGDCEDFSAYLAAAWIRSGLVDAGSVRLIYVAWDHTAHMVAEAARNGEPFWASNWSRCAPRAGPAVAGMRAAVGPLNDVWAWDVALRSDDTVILRNAARLVVNGA